MATKTTKNFRSIDELASWIPDLLEKIGDKQLITLEGDLGAGKTTLVKLLCEAWGVKELVSSPTYNLVNIYVSIDGRTINHLDLYRLESLDEALSAGIEEYVYSSDLTLIEWPGVIADILPDEVVTIQITQVENDERKIVLL